MLSLEVAALLVFAMVKSVCGLTSDHIAGSLG